MGENFERPDRGNCRDRRADERRKMVASAIERVEVTGDCQHRSKPFAAEAGNLGPRSAPLIFRPVPEFALDREKAIVFGDALSARRSA